MQQRFFWTKYVNGSVLYKYCSSDFFRGFVIDGLSVIRVYKGYGIMVVSLKSNRFKNKRTGNQKATSM